MHDRLHGNDITLLIKPLKLAYCLLLIHLVTLVLN